MLGTSVEKIRVIDSHTAGEPTRVIVDADYEPQGKTMAEKRSHFAREFDWLRTATVCEPRGHEAMVGALLCEPCAADCATGVLFLNNVGVLHGCLHGTMGVAVTLLHLGKIGPGTHRFDTPTGVVTVTLANDGAAVTVGNVRSYRAATDVDLYVPDHGPVRGDVAWGGNWFFLTEAPNGIPVHSKNMETLTDFAWKTRLALAEAGITGDDGEEIDHIEIFGPPSDPATADSKNFVLCPGKAYDRSPCGTGTSAKLACLAADGRITPGQVWRQAGILDSLFTGTVELAPKSEGGGVFPTVTGSAYVTGEATFIVDSADPFAMGIPYPINDPTLLNRTLNPIES